MDSQLTVRIRLKEAIGTGELIGVIYHGGSQPGMYREISPVEIEGDKVRAHCHASNAEKMFSIEKIEIPDSALRPDDKSIAWNPHGARPFDSIGEVHGVHLVTLRELGWTVDIERYEDGEAIWLRSKFKNGSLRSPVRAMAASTMLPAAFASSNAS